MPKGRPYSRRRRTRIRRRGFIGRNTRIGRTVFHSMSAQRAVSKRFTSGSIF